MKKVLASLLAISMALSLVSCRAPQAPGTSGTGPSSGAGASSAGSDALDWPTRDITFIQPAGAGGDTDFNGRLMARMLEKKFDVACVTNNITGSNGAVALTQYKDEKADNYTFIMTNTAVLSGNRATGLMDFGYEAFEPVCIFGRSAGETFLVRADAPYDSLQELIEASQAKPNTITYGGPTGGASYLAAYLNLQKNYDAQLAFMEAGDAAERLTALLGGHIDICNAALGTCKEYIEAGQLKSLGSLMSQAPSLMPDMPVSCEQYPEIVQDTMYVCLALKGTDPQVIEAMSQAMLDVIAGDEEYRAECQRMNYQEPWGLSVEDTRAELDKQAQHFMDLAKLMED